jgi:hypothetical protein
VLLESGAPHTAIALVAAGYGIAVVPSAVVISVEAMQNTCFGKELTRRGIKTVKTRTGNESMGFGIKQETVHLKVA